MFLLTYKEGFIIVWPVFGSANHLMAAFVLIAISHWLKIMAKKKIFIIIPAVFMLTKTIYSLTFLLVKRLFHLKIIL